MKKHFKTLLIALIIIPCMAIMAACGDKGGNETPETYTITWVDGNGNTIETDTDVAGGATPTYDGETPTKDETSDFTYTFNGQWTPAIVAVVGNATYTAQFTATPKQVTPETYTITWVDGNGNTIETDTDVAGGATPTYDGETPTKDETSDFTYTFNNQWTPAITAVTGNETYTAQFTATAKQTPTAEKLTAPTVAFIDEEGIFGKDIVRITNVDSRATDITVTVNDSPVTVTETTAGTYEAIVNGLQSGENVVTITAKVTATDYTDSDTTTETFDNHVYLDGDYVNPATVSWANGKFTVSGMDTNKATYTITYKSAPVSLSGNTYTPSNPANGDVFSIKTTAKIVTSNFGYTQTIYNGGGTNTATVSGIKANATAAQPTVTYDGENKQFVVTNNETNADWGNYTFTFDGETVTATNGVYSISAFIDGLGEGEDGETYTFTAKINQFETATTIYSTNSASATFTYTYEDSGTVTPPVGEKGMLTVNDLVTTAMLQNAGVDTTDIDGNGTIDTWEKAAVTTIDTTLAANGWDEPVTASGNDLNDIGGSFGEYLKDKIIFKIGGIADTDISIVKVKFMTIYDPINGGDGEVWFKDLSVNTSGTLGMVLSLKYSVAGYGEFYAKLDLTLNYSGEQFSTSIGDLADNTIGNRYLMHIWDNSTVADFRKQTTLESYARESDYGYKTIFVGDIVQLPAKDPANEALGRFDWEARTIDISTMQNPPQNWSAFMLEINDYSLYNKNTGVTLADRPRISFISNCLNISAYSKKHNNEYMKGLGSTDGDDYTDTIFDRVLPNPDNKIDPDGVGL